MNEILKHSLVYGLGNVLLRLGSLAMLPIVTRSLKEADYGTIAILDLTGATIGVLVGGGMTAAVGRQHFAVKSARGRRRVWGTALAIVALSCLAVLSLLWLLRQPLALMLSGIAPERAVLFLSIMLPHTGLELMAQLGEQYFRIVKRSRLVVALSVVRLLVNMSCNLLLLLVLQWGVAGVLTGNLITASLFATIWCSLLAKTCWPLGFDVAQGRAMLRFGAPLVFGGLGALVMHQADRYFIEMTHGLEEVGRYSLAHTLVYSLAMLLITSFSSIWIAKRFEVADLPDADRIFAQVFQRHLQVFGVAMLGLSLFAPLAIQILAKPEYLSAVPIVPVVGLAYAMYAARIHFESPIYIARRTMATVPIQVGAVALSLALNALLIPSFGIVGAAWATLFTFMAFAGGYYVLAQRIHRIPWPIRKTAIFYGVCVVTYLIANAARPLLQPLAYYALAALLWAAVAGYVLRDMLRGRTLAAQAEEVEPASVELTAS